MFHQFFQLIKLLQCRDNDQLSTMPKPRYLHLQHAHNFAASGAPLESREPPKHIPQTKLNMYIYIYQSNLSDDCFTFTNLLQHSYKYQLAKVTWPHYRLFHDTQSPTTAETWLKLFWKMLHQVPLVKSRTKSQNPDSFRSAQSHQPATHMSSAFSAFLTTTAIYRSYSKPIIQSLSQHFSLQTCSPPS